MEMKWIGKLISLGLTIGLNVLVYVDIWNKKADLRNLLSGYVKFSFVFVCLFGSMYVEWGK
ncbi:hypothetical protein F4804DRAFT_328418 [Jackrogersella minutella]|nr:hypothetical protein F4804DRAFT_328418 [Jackrogersella minutella]